MKALNLSQDHKVLFHLAPSPTSFNSLNSLNKLSSCPPQGLSSLARETKPYSSKFCLHANPQESFPRLSHQGDSPPCHRLLHVLSIVRSSFLYFNISEIGMCLITDAILPLCHSFFSLRYVSNGVFSKQWNVTVLFPPGIPKWMSVIK